MDIQWISKLDTCKAVDHAKKPTIKGALIALMLQGTDPNAAFDGDEQEVKQILEYLYLRGRGQSGGLDALTFATHASLAGSGVTPAR